MKTSFYQTMRISEGRLNHPMDIGLNNTSALAVKINTSYLATDAATDIFR